MRVLNSFRLAYYSVVYLMFFKLCYGGFFLQSQSEDSARFRAETVITFVRIRLYINFVPQNRKKDDTVSGNMKELESTSKENNLKQNNGSPGEEIAQLKLDGEQEHNSGFTKEVLNCPLLNSSSACLAVEKYSEPQTAVYGKLSQFLLLGRLRCLFGYNKYSIEKHKNLSDLSKADIEFSCFIVFLNFILLYLLLS